MSNPPNKPRDDRRMHEGEKPGLGETVNQAAQDEVTPEPGDAERNRPAALDEDEEKRSNA